MFSPETLLCIWQRKTLDKWHMRQQSEFNPDVLYETDSDGDKQYQLTNHCVGNEIITENRHESSIFVGSFRCVLKLLYDFAWVM